VSFIWQFLFLAVTLSPLIATLRQAFLKHTTTTIEKRKKREGEQLQQHHHVRIHTTDQGARNVPRLPPHNEQHQLVVDVVSIFNTAPIHGLGTFENGVILHVDTDYFHSAQSPWLRKKTQKYNNKTV